MQQVDDFLAESEALHAALSDCGDTDLTTTTQFKRWSFRDVVQHLHFFNLMADYSLSDPARFASDYGELQRLRNNGATLVQATDEMLQGLEGLELLESWRSAYVAMCPRLSAVDPRTRVKWVGPDMSVRTSVSARLMETWSHGQSVFDALGLQREETDRVKNIAQLGINTFGWTFVNRAEEVPDPAPHVVLRAPSGAIWTWGEESATNRVAGSAIEFCQVVTQTRNIGDTGIVTSGAVAQRWMELAQCFAGPPQDPPAVGTRFSMSNQPAAREPNA